MASKAPMATPKADASRPKAAKHPRKAPSKAGTGVAQSISRATETKTHLANPNEQLQTTEQSIKTVQQVLHGAISNLSSARGFFTANCYEATKYQFNSPEGGETGREVQDTATFTGLRRGISTKVDNLLNLIVSISTLVETKLR
jgi:hypothetical protein